MASTEELEAQILAEMEANPEAYADTGIEYCTVDDDTRLVTVPDKYKKLGVESDEKAKRVWFRFPKLVGNNGIDLSTIGVRVNFRNANGDGDIYIAEDLTVDGDYVIFSWELSRKVTAYKGHISFVVCAVKSATDGTTKNEWNTTLNKECEVLEGLEVSEQIAQENPDIIEYILANLGGSVSSQEIATAVEEYMAKNPQKDVSYEPQELTEEQKAQARKNIGAEASGTAENKVSTHNTATDAHGDIRLLVQGLTNKLNALADSDDTTLDQMSEVVAYIKSNKSLIDAITTSKINVSDIIDNLTTNVSDKPLSAAQGVALKALIDAIIVPTKLSELENDSGYAKTTDIPDKLPNPYALTINGTSYDGSNAVNVTVTGESGGNGWSKVAEFEYNLNDELIVDSFTSENKYLHFTTAHGLVVGDYLLIRNYETIKTSKCGYTTVTDIIDENTVVCDSITNTSDFSGNFIVEKSAGRVLFEYDGLITKPFARMRISGKTIFLSNKNWTYSTYYSNYGSDMLMKETDGRVTSGNSVVSIKGLPYCGRVAIISERYNPSGYLIVEENIESFSYTRNYNPVPIKHVYTPQLVFNGLRIIVEEADEWDIP